MARRVYLCGNVDTEIGPLPSDGTRHCDMNAVHFPFSGRESAHGLCYANKENMCGVGTVEVVGGWVTIVSILFVYELLEL